MTCEDVRTSPSCRGSAYPLLDLQARGQLFIKPGTKVYEGMIVGVNARAEDMNVNATKERKLANVRSSTGEELIRLAATSLLRSAGLLARQVLGMTEGLPLW